MSKGDRVLIYMPMIPEAVYAMLACVRIGAVHSVVFGGFASASLAQRVDDCSPKVMVTADAGLRGGRVIPYKGLVDEALTLSTTPPANVILVNRGLVSDIPWASGRDVDYNQVIGTHEDARVGCNTPIGLSYTSAYLRPGYLAGRWNYCGSSKHFGC